MDSEKATAIPPHFANHDFVTGKNLLCPFIRGWKILARNIPAVNFPEDAGVLIIHEGGGKATCDHMMVSAGKSPERNPLENIVHAGVGKGGSKPISSI